MEIGLFEIVVVGALVGLAIGQRNRVKVQDQQFKMLLIRLNELTNRDVEDSTIPLDPEKK